MQKQEADILIANAAADVMNQRIFSKVKSSLIGLYSDREDFYKRVQFDYDGHAIRTGVIDRKSYKKICAVLSSYKDDYTFGEIMAGFSDVFCTAIVDMIIIEKRGKKKNMELKIGFPEEPDGAFLTKILAFTEYLNDVCDMNTLGYINERLDSFLEKKLPANFPPELLGEVKRLYMNNMMFLEGYKNRTATVIKESEDDKALIGKFSCNTAFYDACLYGMRGLFEPTFFENDFDIDMFKSCFDMNTEDYARNECLLSAFDKFNVDVIPTKEMVDNFKMGGYTPEEISNMGVYACMRSCFARSMLGMQKYSDEQRFIQSIGLTKQEIRRIIASTYLWAEKVGINVPVYPENSVKCSLLINDMVQNGVALLLRKSRKNSLASTYNAQNRDEKAAAKGEKKKESSNLQRVLEENKRLQSSLNQANLDLKAKKDIEKVVRGEMSDMRKDFEARLKELEAELEKTKAENIDLQKQLDDEEFVSDDNDGITKEDILKAGKGKTVLVWGIRTEIADRLIAEYGDMVNCIATDDYQNGLLPSGALEKCDAAIIVTNYSSHSRYWKARDEIKASGVPYAHLRRNINSPERIGKLIWKVLSGEENRNL